MTKRRAAISARGRRWPDQLATMCALLSSLTQSTANAGALQTPYEDPAQLISIPFGAHSHWAQPWRAYLETVPAMTLLRAVGVNLTANANQDPKLVCRMLAQHGVKVARIQVGWGRLDAATKQLVDQPLRDLLLACKENGIRPLIVLHADSAAPCPMTSVERTVVSAAGAGSTVVTLDSASGLVSNRTGLSNLSEPWAAEALITYSMGNTVYLTKPLPVSLAPGTKVAVTTLSYRPFSPEFTSDYSATMQGWRSYVQTVFDFAASALDTLPGDDRGFDLEIWDRLSPGGHFLSINDYYDPPLYSYPQQDIWWQLVSVTATLADSMPWAFTGVGLSDGFGNSVPWPASSTEPARVNALSHQPAIRRQTYPADEQSGPNLNALRQEDPWVPTYSAVFPEAQATMLETESVIRDMAPLTTSTYGTPHGRNGRSEAGNGGPVPVWITRLALSPTEHSITDPTVAAKLKARVATRSLAFYAGKGAERLAMFEGTGGDLGPGLLTDDFLAYAAGATTYPTDDAPYTSTALAAVGRMVTRLGQGLDVSITSGRTRRLSVLALSDRHDHVQFQGDGTTEHPALYDRDVFTFLPFQVSKHRFLIAYYVMTRDVTNPFTPEAFSVSIGGLDSRGAVVVTAYDPIEDRDVPVTVLGTGADRVALEVTAADYPYLLLIQEDPSNPPVDAGVMDARIDGDVSDGGPGDGSALDGHNEKPGARGGGCGCSNAPGTCPAGALIAAMLMLRRLRRRRAHDATSMD